MQSGHSYGALKNPLKILFKEKDVQLKRITFIRPNMGNFRATDAMEPLVFAILAARTPKHIEIKFYDDRLETIPLEESTDLVAITVETFTARRAYEIARGYRAKGIPVVMGGYHPTLLPEECANHADALVCGDAEGLWEQLLQDLAQGELKPLYQHQGEYSIHGPLPDRSLFKSKKYLPISLIQYGRGCRFNCDFCSIRAFYGTQQPLRPLEEVVNEIKSLKQRLVLFVDDNLYSSPQNIEQLCHALKPLKIRWVCQVTVDVTRNEKLLQLMVESGCLLALIGFESLNSANLKQMRKNWNIERDYQTALQRLRRNGIMVYGTFIFGYDHDRPEVFDHTLNFSLENKFFLANFNPLAPTPGTPLYQRLRDENRLLFTDWWLDPEYRYGNAIIKPKNMSAEQLRRGCLSLRKRFYGIRSIFSRSLSRPGSFYKPGSLGPYLLANLVSRREILNKQNQRLGP